jgi:transcriptional regulator with XRE-family HTH domain
MSRADLGPCTNGYTVISDARPKARVEKFHEIGQRLRAYRLGAGLASEEIAERLNVSRAAVYRIEAGEIVKIDTLGRLAEVLGTSLASLLGVGAEYYSNALSYFERMRQIEARADQVVAHFEPVSYLLTTPAYTNYLREMLLEALPRSPARNVHAVAEISHIIEVLEERKAAFRQRRLNVVSLVTVAEVERFMELGLIGRLDLPTRERARRRKAARAEMEHLAELMAEEAMGVQIALIEDSMPNVTFQIFRTPDRTYLGVSPFRLGEQPNIRLGIATVTEAEEPVALYDRLAQDLWQRGLKGGRAAKRLTELIRR